MSDDATEPDGMPEDPAEHRREIERIGEIPGMYVDTWHLYTWSGHMRITYGEIIGEIDRYRSALVMTLDDAETLAKQMLRMIDRRRRREKERQMAAEGSVRD